MSSSDSNPEFRSGNPRDDDFEIPESITVKLRRPHRKLASEETLAELAFRIPTARDLKAVRNRSDKSDALSAATLAVSMLSKDGMTEVDVDHLLAVDLERIVEALQPFLTLPPRSEVGRG